MLISIRVGKGTTSFTDYIWGLNSQHCNHTEILYFSVPYYHGKDKKPSRGGQMETLHNQVLIAIALPGFV